MQHAVKRCLSLASQSVTRVTHVVLCCPCTHSAHQTKTKVYRYSCHLHRRYSTQQTPDKGFINRSLQQVQRHWHTLTQKRSQPNHFFQTWNRTVFYQIFEEENVLCYSWFSSDHIDSKHSLTKSATKNTHVRLIQLPPLFSSQ